MNPYKNQSKADIYLSWENPRTDPQTASPLYRVRVLSIGGILSDPSDIVGPVYLSTHPWKTVIRRKPYDGTIPSYDGSDAMTVAELTDMTQTQWVDTVHDQENWHYAVYRVDRGGYPSVASTIAVPVGDLTPPVPVTGISVVNDSMIL